MPTCETGRLPFHRFHARLPVVRLRRLLVVLVSLAEDELVVAQAKRVAVDRHRVQVDVRVRALGLPG